MNLRTFHTQCFRYACVSISEVPAKENFVAAVGTLGFLVVVLLTLLIVAVVALTYFVLIKPKQMYRYIVSVIIICTPATQQVHYNYYCYSKAIVCCFNACTCSRL